MNAGLLRLPPGADHMSMVGRGRRDDPFILAACDNRDSVFGRLRAWRRMEGGIGASWKIVDWATVDAGPGHIERVQLLRRQFTEKEVQTDEMAFFYDVSAVPSATPPSCSPIVWTDGGVIQLPHDLAWMHFDSAASNSRVGPMDVSLFYSSPFGKASIYVYGGCDDGDELRIRAEAERAIEGANAANPDAVTPWEPTSVGPLYGQFLQMPEELSFAGVTSRGGKFIKLRITVTDGEQILREMLNECLYAICLAIDGRAVSWTPAAH